MPSSILADVFEVSKTKLVAIHCVLQASSSCAPRSPTPSVDKSLTVSPAVSLMAAEPPAKDSKQPVVVLLLALAVLPLVLPLKYILLALAVIVAAFILLPRRTPEAAATTPQSAEQQPTASRATDQPTFDSPAAGPAPADVTLSAADGIAREDTRPPPAEPDVPAAKAAQLPPPNGKSGPVAGGAAILARLRCFDEGFHAVINVS